MAYYLVLATKPVAQNGSYTSCNENSCICYMINHCMLSHNLYDKCGEITITDRVDNSYDHLSLLLTLKVNTCHYSLKDIAHLFGELG